MIITLHFDTATGLAKLAQPAIIKVGADVRVKVVFSSAPGAGTDIEFALLTDAADPDTLAFTDVFTEENPTTWTALLDASDTRLINFMAGKNATQVNGELVCVIDGERQIAPNVNVTVQPSRETGSAGNMGGPPYGIRNLHTITALTGGAATALDSIVVGAAPYFAGALAALNVDGAAILWRLRQNAITGISVHASAPTVTTSKPHGLTTGQTVAIGGSNSTPSIDGNRVVTVTGANTFTVAIATTVAGTAGFATPVENVGNGLVRPDNFHATTNPYYWQSAL